MQRSLAKFMLKEPQVRSQSFKISPAKKKPSESPTKGTIFFNVPVQRPLTRLNNAKLTQSSTRITDATIMHRKQVSDAQLPKLSPIKPRHDLTTKRQVSKWSIIRDIAYKSQAGKTADRVTKINQDAHTIGDLAENIKIVGVHDGHGQEGHRCSQFIRDNLQKNLRSLISTCSVGEAIQKAFQKTNQQLISNDIQTAFSGTTTVISLLMDKVIYTANVGDSRAVIGRLHNHKITPVALSFDHKPDLHQERKRIENAGGRVQAYQDYDGSFVGPARVWKLEEDVPGLAMSRSFGDEVAASCGVISDPDVTVHNVHDNDLFLVLASDGVWEFYSNEQVVEMVYPYYMMDQIEAGTNFVVKESTKQWRQNDEVIDDITCVLVFFQH